jgi:hypothetical protein
MGAVYEALDRRTDQRVALKTVLDMGSAALYGFKQEFRTLADVRHRNLVRLHELVVSDVAPVFFTMELVEGVDFLHHVRVDAGPTAHRTPSDDATLNDRSDDRGTVDAGPGPGVTAPVPVDYEKLRPALRQLVDGLRALHDAGKLHRDIKPSNVLVTGEGRVVLLDFGVATDLRRMDGMAIGSANDDVVGTPKYMSPEQAAGEPTTAASDLYSVGVMLYEALVGRTPFEGSSFDVLTRKSLLMPVAPAECVAGIPGDLNDLCMALLQIDADARPTSSEVLRALGSSGRGHSLAPRAAPSVPIGREAEMRALREAYLDARAGQAVTVRVSGEAGMGKSALVRGFLDELLAEGQTNVLTGRAYERESVPYKAVDGVIDSLSQLLLQLDEDLGDRAPRRRLQALALLFPVLDRVATIHVDGYVPDESPQTERRRAFRELRDCLASLARRRPLVLFIDDIHCGDADSAALLLEVMRSPGAPPILLLMTALADSADRSPFVAEMAAAWRGELREVRVGRLSAPQALELARTLLDPALPNAERLARAVARESGGSPLLVRELIRSHRHDVGPEGATLMAGTIESMLANRLAALSEPSRLLAELVAVAGRPLPIGTLTAAAGIAGVKEPFAALEAAGLARLAFRGDRETAEPVHDRLRDGVLAQLSRAAVKDHHGRLADSLSATNDCDMEALATHLFGAGRTAEAARCAEQAAARASSKLAFDLSVRLLRMALDATAPDAPASRQLRARLAQTLVHAGRASAAADEYGALAKEATGIDRVALQRAAAEQLLMSGRMDEGRVAFRQVLDAMGLRVPQSALGAVLLLVLYQVRLVMAGVRVPDRESGDVSPEDRTYIDTLRAVAVGLSAVDVIMGACMQAKYMLVATARGDKVDVLRGLCAQMIQNAMIRPVNRRERRIVEAARSLAAQMGGEVHSYVVQAQGLSLYMRGHFREALESLDTVGRGVPGVWNTVNARIFALYACIFLGKHREVARRAPRFLRDAEERGDRYTTVCLRTTAMVDVALANDDPEEARRHVREAMASWTQAGFHTQHWYAMWSDVLIELYAGNPAAAYERLERDAPVLRRSLLLRVQLVRGMTAYLRACSAIASIEVARSAKEQRIAEAHRLAAHLAKQSAVWAPTLATVVRACALNAAGHRATGVSTLREAIRLAEGAHLWPQVWGARYQLGRALGGVEGRGLVQEAARCMLDEGIMAPERTAATVVPGIWG